MRKWCSASGSSQMLPAVSTIELPGENIMASFPPVHGGGRDIKSVVTVSQDSRPLVTITTAHARAEGLCGFSTLTQLIRIHLEQALMRSN
jgi:hypothetical protein